MTRVGAGAHMPQCTTPHLWRPEDSSKSWFFPSTLSLRQSLSFLFCVLQAGWHTAFQLLSLSPMPVSPQEC